MLSAGPQPGLSAQSLVEVPEGAAAPCSTRYDPRCAAPWRSRFHGGRWVRVETYEEGLSRYWGIARAVARATGENDRLARLVVTVTRHESGWRRDVHSGIGPDSKGDNGHSWGLGQAMVGLHPNSPVPHTKYRARDIVGTDEDSTQRCISTVARYLEIATDHCERIHGGPACPFSVYGGARSGPPSRLVLQRVRTLSQLPDPPAPLSDEVRTLLGLP
jgi:hypothetical protein